MPTELNYLFIAGASRSGTTLLTNLLDGHPELLVFPLEHKTFKHFFTQPEKDRGKYFPGPFIEERSQGQQSVLAREELFQQYSDRIAREFGTTFDLAVACDRFHDGYLQFLQPEPVTLRRVLAALSFGLAAANDHAGSVYPRAKYAVFKDPFTTEFFAQRTAALIPEARFLHIVRDPYARYCSIKMRRLRTGRVLHRAFIPRVNFRDFVTGLAEQAISSLHCGLENHRALGEERYRMLRFEDLVHDPEAVLRGLAEWLGVSRHGAFLQPSKLGKAIASGSSFSPTKGIDAGTTDRRTQFERMTSASERDVYLRCIAASEYRRFYDLMEPQRRQQLLREWIRPYRHERIRDFLWRVATGQAWMGKDADASVHGLVERLPRLYASGLLG